MNDMYEKGYQDGYNNGHKDGYQKGWHAARIQRDTYVPKDEGKCPKCGMTLKSPMGYVCNSPNCPTFMQVTC
jgi:hypothetical protein